MISWIDILKINFTYNFWNVLQTGAIKMRKYFILFIYQMFTESTLYVRQYSNHLGYIHEQNKQDIDIFTYGDYTRIQ